MIDYKGVFRQLPGYYLLLDTSLKIIDATQNYMSITYTDSSIIGKNIFTVFPQVTTDSEKGVNSLKETFEIVLKTKKTERMHVVQYDIIADGEVKIRYWRPIIIPILENGQVTALISSIFDVTDVVRLEKTSKEAKHILDLTLKLNDAYYEKIEKLKTNGVDENTL